MVRHRLEVADVFRSQGQAYLEAYGTATSSTQRQVLRALSKCRTAALGGHKLKCDQCGHEEISYNSCRDRHCPKCQATERAEWLEAKAADLLEVPYFHVVFTLPEQLGPLTLQNKRTVYRLLFRAVSETLITIGKDPKHLGAEIGFLAVLHTWGQKLDHHPHIHCVVPGGGISPDRSRWVHSRKDFLFAVRVLSRLFRRKFLSLLKDAFDKKDIGFHGKIKQLENRKYWMSFLGKLEKRDWVVYCKPPFGGAAQTLKYLARYTHRVAISNQRLLAFEQGRVTFRWKDYSRNQSSRTITLNAVEFIRRFLQHVLPKGFQRIRQYGFLANRVRKERLDLCRQLIGHSEITHTEKTENIPSALDDSSDETSAQTCPSCKEGQLLLLGEIQPDRKLFMESMELMKIDSS